jgi:ABC-2 type transport system ATP-binding protein
MKVVLEAENLKKVFKRPWLAFGKKASKKDFTAVDQLSFALREGEILGLLGPNGAGKTTTIQMLLGLLTPTAGKIFYFGQDFDTHRSQSLQKVSHASAYSKLPGTLTVLENLEVFCHLYGLSGQERKERIDRFLKLFEIEDLKNQQARSLSAGQMTRVMLCKAFMSQPQVVLLDEPTASLDPDISKEVRKFILRQQKEFGVSAILTSHNMQEVAEVCSRALVLQHGKILEEDTPQKLAKSIALSRVCLKVDSGLAAAIQFIESQSWSWTKMEDILSVNVDEAVICTLLRGLALADVQYTHIELQKPTLEDYFVHISHSASR